MKYVFICCLLAPPVFADPIRVYETATNLFDNLPALTVSQDLDAACGGGRNSNDHIGFCTTKNQIFITDTFGDRDTAEYELAHILGHAIQVRHGVADIALREIRNRRDEEDALREMVTKQVECVAGVLLATAGEPRVDLRSFGAEPFTDAHWGRDPINSGPRVSIGLEARAEWFDIGYNARDFAACSVGEMSADLILQALR